MRFALACLVPLFLAGCMTQQIKHASTAALRLQYVQAGRRLMFESGYRQPEVGFGKTARDYDILELERISDELNRRWVAGDRSAYLGGFEKVNGPGAATGPTRTAVAPSRSTGSRTATRSSSAGASSRDRAPQAYPYPVPYPVPVPYSSPRSTPSPKPESRGSKPFVI